MTAPSALLSAGIRPLTPAPAPERHAEPLRLTWEVRPVRVLVEVEGATGTARANAWEVAVEGCRAGYYRTEAEAIEIARNLADDPVSLPRPAPVPCLAAEIARAQRCAGTLPTARARGGAR